MQRGACSVCAERNGAGNGKWKRTVSPRLRPGEGEQSQPAEPAKPASELLNAPVAGRTPGAEMAGAAVCIPPPNTSNVGPPRCVGRKTAGANTWSKLLAGRQTFPSVRCRRALASRGATVGAICRRHVGWIPVQGFRRSPQWPVLPNYDVASRGRRPNCRYSLPPTVVSYGQFKKKR